MEMKTSLMTHLIAFARISSKQYAYSYSVKNTDIKKLIQKKYEIVSSLSHKARPLITFHIMRNECTNFNKIITNDPYFKNSKLFSNWTECVKEINEISASS